MSLIDDITRSVAGQLLGGNAPQGLLGLALKLVNSPEVGGLAGLAQLFNKQGLGQAMSSWISTGKNLPISAEQILAVLGKDRVQEMAGQINAPSGQVTEGLSALLPQIIDQLTPDGKLPAEDALTGALTQLASGLFRA